MIIYLSSLSCNKIYLLYPQYVCFLDVPDEYYYRTAKVGQTIKFPCPTKLIDDVNWLRLDTPQSDGTYIYRILLGPVELGQRDPRFKVLDINQSRSLVIYNVTVDDSAYYQCIEDGGFGIKHFYGLTVEGTFCASITKQKLILFLHCGAKKDHYCICKYMPANNLLWCQLFWYTYSVTKCYRTKNTLETAVSTAKLVERRAAIWLMPSKSMYS